VLLDLRPRRADVLRSALDRCLPHHGGVPLRVQAFWLFILAIPISSVAWTITHEEIFREAREFCNEQSKACRSLIARKAFYVFTCEFCLSHWVTLVFVLLTGYRLLLEDWRGFVIAIFALVWVSNLYMSIYGRLRLGIKAERKEIEIKEEVLERGGVPDGKHSFRK
jgi:hypothetical protein